MAAADGNMGGKVGLTPLADDASAAMESQVTNEFKISAEGGGVAAASVSCFLVGARVSSGSD